MNDRDVSTTLENRLGVRSAQDEMNVRPIERISHLELDLHWIGVDLLDDVKLLGHVTH